MLITCFQTHVWIINIIINEKNKKLLYSIIVTAKSSKKNERKQLNEMRMHNYGTRPDTVRYAVLCHYATLILSRLVTMHKASGASCGILYYPGLVSCPFYAIPLYLSNL